MMTTPGSKSSLAVTLLGIAAAGMVVLSLCAVHQASIEKTMGLVQKVFYYHVGCGIATVLGFTTVMVCSVCFLATRKEKYDIAARSAAGIGVLFCTLVLATGSIWAKGAWDRWWLWDEPRLVTSLVMWFLYLAYLMLGMTHGDDRARSARFSAVYGIVSFLIVPVVFFSTRTKMLAEAPVIGGLIKNAEGSRVHPATIDLAGEGMRAALRLSMMTFGLLFVFLFVLRLRMELLSARADRLHQRLEDIEEIALVKALEENPL